MHKIIINEYEIFFPLERKSNIGQSKREDVIEKILCEVRKRGQQSMIGIKLIGWKVTAKKSVSNIKVDQHAMVEECYRNEK